MLTQLLLLIFVGGIFAWVVENHRPGTAKWVSLFTIIIASLSFIDVIRQHPGVFIDYLPFSLTPWISSFNIYYATAADSLSVVLIYLTLFLAVICILVSWKEIKHRVGFYYFNLMASIAGIIGVFIASDLFLFFFFWEVMLLPMTALIAIWGHEKRVFAAIKFFIFTQLSSLLMLVAIIALAFVHKQQTGVLSFDYFALQKLTIDIELQWYLMLGFFIAFAVKLPSFPVHSWLPDAHTQAPTAGSVLLAGVLLKTGAYGLIRFVLPLFPDATEAFADTAMLLGVISIIYGAKLAFAQTDFKRLVAYSSISHMGFIMLALFSFNAIAYQGALVTMVAHGLSSAALFSMAGFLYQRLHSRDLVIMGGLFASAPIMGGMLLAFVAAAFGLPGMLNFVGEFMALVGSFASNPTMVIIAALGLIGSAIYGMHLFQRSFQGKVSHEIIDLNARELLVCISLLGALILFGMKPNLLLNNLLVTSAGDLTVIQPIANANSNEKVNTGANTNANTQADSQLTLLKQTALPRISAPVISSNNVEKGDE
ncbi:complex I subunit 4 family protein [Thalassotalea crassostreae]|uniref:complex I subunit 4 family protein n=1 Tax=Thalassotalea crassostreae TaxID=1763536 RepID=UPI0008381125|nr:NADH-quinone oxidoreductase subunit M [Thalassotalea crassostreae]